MMRVVSDVASTSVDESGGAAQPSGAKRPLWWRIVMWALIVA